MPTQMWLLALQVWTQASLWSTLLRNQLLTHGLRRQMHHTLLFHHWRHGHTAAKTLLRNGCGTMTSAKLCIGTFALCAGGRRSPQA